MTDLPLLSSKRIMLELALQLEGSGDEVADIIERNQISPEQLLIMLANPVFKADLARVRDEVREHGLTFRIKARTMAEELLKTTWQITQSDTTSPAVKADLIKSVVEWGDLKPKNKETGQGTGGGVRILINLSNNGGFDAGSSQKVHEIVGIPEICAPTE